MSCSLCLLVGRKVPGFDENVCGKWNVCSDCMASVLGSLESFTLFDTFVCRLRCEQMEYEKGLVDSDLKAKSGALKKALNGILHLLKCIIPCPDVSKLVDTRQKEIQRIFCRIAAARNKFKRQMELFHVKAHLTVEANMIPMACFGTSFRPTAQKNFRSASTTKPTILAAKKRANARYDAKQRLLLAHLRRVD